MSIEHVVPNQEKGASTDTSSEVRFESQSEASDFFQVSRGRLLDISNWDQICGPASAKFQLTDYLGNPVERDPQIGDHFKINIPAPGTETGDGRDWVQIENLIDQCNSQSDYECVAIKVRPATNPTNEAKDTAHFFKEDATSTFLVERKGSVVRAEVHGRNEVPNIEADGILDTIRNAVVALGAMAGISTPQWKSLVNGLVKTE